MARQPKYYLTACAILRNEARYIHEWLAFHAAVGVEHFFLYDNNSDDGMAEKILGFSHPEMITLTPWPVHPGQGRAYRNAINTFGRTSRWMAFLDGDEFLFSTETPDLRVFLRQFEHRSALAVHWLIYGSSGHVERPAGLQIENYLHRSDRSYISNQHIKSIVQPRYAGRSVTPHIFELLEGHLVREDDQIVGKTIGRLDVPSISDRIRINHYFGRSREDWTAKVARGRATTKEVRPFVMFDRNDRNEVFDDSALAVRPLMERFLNPSFADRMKALLVTRPFARMRYARRARWIAAHPEPPPKPPKPKKLKTTDGKPKREAPAAEKL